ncbi:alpha/beta fold hydrolase [Cryptosporangium arvum]|uniref:alpha/beta fold hydrolase n=1 Tax=Cryptosporangium arvum TaxID=80871 RepID=UPI0004AD7F1C|nr:alpha/beta fold hydrolase [Cryptosporangium arvum]
MSPSAVVVDRREFTVHVGDVPLSGLMAIAPEARSTIVAVHGAVARGTYFDGRAPGQSLVETAVALGHTVLALDRPGYGASGEFVRGSSRSERAALYCAAVREALARHGATGPRLVVSHSAGAAQAAVLVTGGLEGVVGWELCGSGLRHAPVDFSSGPAPRHAHTGDSIRDLIWGAEELYPPGGMNTGFRRGDSIRAEPGDAEAWQRELPSVAARVRVPVRLTFGELDRIWDHTPEATTELAATFTRAPRVVTNLQPGAPHNMSLAHAARAYHLGVLAFAEQCLLGAESRDRLG